MKTNIVLLVNLGSPESLSKSAIKKFLADFLSDKRVVNLPKILWYPILYGIILRVRPAKLLHKYAKIWLNGKSPLHYYTEQQTESVQKLFDQSNDNVIIKYAYSYGSQNIASVLNQSTSELDNNYKLTIIPLFPQYSSSTTAVIWDQLSNYYKTKYFVPDINFINSFHDDSMYIQALANSIKKSWQEKGKSDKLLLSFHSIPVALVKNGDTYLTECKKTFELLIKELEIDHNDAILTFQSRFGNAKWIEPFTANTIAKLAKENVQSIDVICPGFVSDCLETLEEIQIENKQLFLENGGKIFNYIPCLNDSSDLTTLLTNLIRNYK